MTTTANSISDATTRAGIVFDDRYLWHNTGLGLIDEKDNYLFSEPVPHVSSPALVSRAKQLIDHFGISDRMTRIPAYEADDEAIRRVHTVDYMERVRELDRTGGDAGDGAPIGIGGERIARLAAGGVMAAVDAVMTERVRHAYALVRPPGHHAMADIGMGFCIFANVAIAAHHARRHYGVRKIMILDWDVHHGNGTQSAFYEDPDVLFFSLHQDNLYPTGWGTADQTGEGPGNGFTVNMPLPGGTGWAGYREAYDRIVLPIARQFAPEFVFVSAGQDASVLDPLAQMCLTTANYREMARMMLGVAAESAGGRLVVAQEGGYAPNYAPYCSAAIAEALVHDDAANPIISEPYGPRATTQPAAVALGLDAAAAIEVARTVQKRFWNV